MSHQGNPDCTRFKVGNARCRTEAVLRDVKEKVELVPDQICFND